MRERFEEWLRVAYLPPLSRQLPVYSEDDMAEAWQAAVAAESARREGERCVWTEAQDHGRVERQFDGCNGRWGYTDTHGFKYCPDCGKRIEIKEEASK
jgi:hypothetical protein